MSTYDSLRQVGLARDVAARATAKARVPVRHETRRPGTARPAPEVATPGDGATADAVIVRVTLSEPLPQTSARTGDFQSTRRIGTSRQVGEGTPDSGTVYDYITFADGPLAGQAAVVPEVVSVDIELIAGVDYANIANTHRSQSQFPEYILSGGSTLSERDIERAAELDVGEGGAGGI